MTCTLHHPQPLEQVDFWNTLQMNTNEETPVGELHERPTFVQMGLWSNFAWKSSTAGSMDSHYKQLFLLLIGSCECMSNGYFNTHLYDKNFHVEF